MVLNSNSLNALLDLVFLAGLFNSRNKILLVIFISGVTVYWKAGSPYYDGYNEATNSLGHTTVYEYNADQLCTKITNPDGYSVT
ncbi:hypothetical protein ABD74_19210 [Brevibacillus laterosporus]|nr:hypothetical protein [Brevibacillus laterosporus]